MALDQGLVGTTGDACCQGVTIENPTDTIAMLRRYAFDVRDRLRDISTETLVVCGAQDPSDPEMFAETAFRMPNGKLIIEIEATFWSPRQNSSGRHHLLRG